MPTILDNIDRALLPAWQGMLEVAQRADFCAEHITTNALRTILLSATPHNKTYLDLDLSSQLRLFVPEDQELPIRPERKADQDPEIVCSLGVFRQRSD